jgi:hypothetical protein
MKNFDEKRHLRRSLTVDDRSFTLGGEIFVAKASMRPEALTDYDRIDETTSLTETLQIVDGVILKFLEKNPDNAPARYRKIRENEDDPVTVEDLLDLVQWLVEVQTGRPTGRPDDFSPGPSETGTTSTENSSSPVMPEALTV